MGQRRGMPPYRIENSARSPGSKRRVRGRDHRGGSGSAAKWRTYCTDLTHEIAPGRKPPDTLGAATRTSSRITGVNVQARTFGSTGSSPSDPD